MWHTVLQPASFKGAAFDVENVEERNGRVLAEHARPFADGTDLEDMGTSGREVRISAVFWGKGYAVRLKNLLDKLEERGAGVLVHPVWGRMTDMAAAEWSYRHEADYADFARIDMTFREAAEPQEIFVFENHFLMEIERLIVQTDALRAAAEGFIDALAAGAEARGVLFGSAAALWSVLAGSLAAVRRLPGWDAVRFRPRGDDDGKTFAAAFPRLAADAARQGLHASAAVGGADLRLRHAVLPDKADALPPEFFPDKADALPRAVAAESGGNAGEVRRRVQTALAAVWTLAVAAAFAEAAAAVLEEFGESAIVPDLMLLNREVRRRVQTALAAVRALPSEGRREAVFGVEEALRATAGRFDAAVRAAANRRPPLLVRAAPFDGPVYLLAHTFYGDWRRAEEILRLNQHIAHPSFVARGAWLNLYAQGLL
ncbi:TPA: DNA circularization protein [Neisseria cinerea]